MPADIAGTRFVDAAMSEARIFCRLLRRTQQRARMSSHASSHVLCFLSALAVLTGCGAPPESGESMPPEPRPATEAAVSGESQADPAQPAPSDSLRLLLELPERVPPGRAVPITLVVENLTDRPLALYLRGRTIAFDLTVRRADGGVVWRRLEDEVIPAILRIEPLQPRGRLELSAEWDQRTNAGEPVPPGDYEVQGELLTEQDPLATPHVRLRVTGASGS